MKKYRIVGELADNGAVYYKVQERNQESNGGIDMATCRTCKKF